MSATEPERVLAVGCGLSLLLHTAFQLAFTVAVVKYHDWAYATGVLDADTEAAHMRLETVYLLLAFFATQLLYLLPAAYVLKRLGRPKTARFLALQSGVLFLLGGLCNGLLLLPSAIH